MNMRHRIGLAFAALLACGAPLPAQTVAVQSGTLVRATLSTDPNKPLVGTMTGRSADSLTILTKGGDAIVHLPMSAVRSLEVMNGKERIAPAVQWGIVAGGLWAVVAAVIPYDNCAERRTEYCANSRGEFVGTQAFGMSLIAGAIGAIRGRERWVTIEGTAPTPFIAPSARGISAGLRVGLE